MSEMIPGALLARISAQIEDEQRAVVEYDELAMIASNLNYKTIGATLRDIAADEARHRSSLGQILKRLEFDSRWSDRQIWPASTSRPVPQAYDDWANLGIDIINKDDKLRQEVYDCLSEIHSHTSREEESKRWLAQKAGELGIT